MKTLTITIERKPITVNFDGKSIEVDELGIRLPLAENPLTSKKSPLTVTTLSMSPKPGR